MKKSEKITELERNIRGLEYENRKLQEQLDDARTELRTLPDSQINKAIDYILNYLNEKG